jgi:hypothetical protein
MLLRRWKIRFSKIESDEAVSSGLAEKVKR